MRRELTPQSTVRELFETPVGHDVLAKILLQPLAGIWVMLQVMKRQFVLQ